MTDKTIAFLISGDVEITEAMVDAGNKTGELVYSADCISSLDGLGGGTKKADAPPEIAQYFDRLDGEFSTILLMFQSMDALSSTPYGHPTLDMLQAGAGIMSSMINATYLKSILKNHPDTDVSDVHPDVLTLALDTRSTVAIMYNAMIMSTREEPEAEKTLVRIHREDANATNMASFVVTGIPAAKALSAKLVADSVFFSVTPLPDGQYDFSVKAASASALSGIAHWHFNAQQVIDHLKRLHPELKFSLFPLCDYDQYAEIDAPEVLVSFGSEAQELDEGIVDPYATIHGAACDPSVWGLSTEAARLIQQHNRVFVAKYPNCDGPRSLCSKDSLAQGKAK